MGQLPSLATLDLSGCMRLAALPESIGQLSSLTTLDTQGCTFESEHEEGARPY
jgi:Leucine-rich repeat (LRR) protein